MITNYDKILNKFKLTAHIKTPYGYFHPYTEYFITKPTHSQIIKLQKIVKLWATKEYLCYRCFTTNKVKDMRLDKESNCKMCKSCKCRTFLV